MPLQRCGAPERTSRRRLLGALPSCALAWVLAAAAGSAAGDLRQATALLMVEDRGCPFCARFDAEARESYVNSPEGRLAPLVRRLRGAADIAFLDRIVYSPTFVLLVEGREVGRIVGYQGADLFWMEMAGLLRKAGLQATTGG